MDQDEKRDEREVGTDVNPGEDLNQPTGTSGNDTDLQTEGDLGTGGTRNEPDSERRPGGSREQIGGGDTGTSNE